MKAYCDAAQTIAGAVKLQKFESWPTKGWPWSPAHAPDEQREEPEAMLAASTPKGREQIFRSAEDLRYCA